MPQGVPQLRGVKQWWDGKRNRHTHMAVPRLPGVSYRLSCSLSCFCLPKIPKNSNLLHSSRPSKVIDHH